MRLTIMRLGLMLGFVLGAAAGRTADRTLCTFEQMQADPTSVITPCTEIIGMQTTPSEQRAEAYFVRGHGYGRTGRISLAAQDYDLAIKLAPEKSEYYVSRASTEAKRGNYKRQIEDLNHALTLDPRNAHAYRALGNYYSDYGWTDQALQLETQALSIDPHEPYALLARTELYKTTHQFDLASKDLTNLVDIPAADINKLGFVDYKGQLQDFHALALIKRGEFDEDLNNLNAAELDYGAAIAQKRNESTIKARADFLLRRQRRDEALRDYNEALRTDPNEPFALYGRGISLLESSEFSHALDDFDRVLKIWDINKADDYTFYSTLRMRARALRGLDRTDEAVASLHKAVYGNRAVRDETNRTLVALHYFQNHDRSQDVETQYDDALRACMIDPTCN